MTMIDYPKSREEKAEEAVVKSGKNEIQVKLGDILQFFARYAFVLIGAVIVSGILGVAFSFTMTKRYEARIVLLPEYGASRRSSFSLLAAGLGGEGAEKLSPDLYPTILQSSPFAAFLLNQPVKDQFNKPYASLKQFLNRERKKKEPGFLSRFFPSEPPKAPVKLTYEGVLSYSPEEQTDIARALSLLTANVDQKSGVIDISAETEDPFVSAIAAENAKQYLMSYVEDYRTTKAQQNVKRLSSQVADARAKLSRAEVALQNYRDRNRNMFANVARIEEQRLQSDFVLAQSLYNDLALRFEQAKVSVKDEKPVFKVLEPAKVPLSKSSPKRLRVGLIFAFLGGFLCLLYILIRKEKVLSYMIEANR